MEKNKIESVEDDILSRGAGGWGTSYNGLHREEGLNGVNR